MGVHGVRPVTAKGRAVREGHGAWTYLRPVHYRCGEFEDEPTGV